MIPQRVRQAAGDTPFDTPVSNLHKSCAIIGKRYHTFNRSCTDFARFSADLRPKGEKLTASFISLLFNVRQDAVQLFETGVADGDLPLAFLAMIDRHRRAQQFT